ncbi:hypothetical protein ABTH41_19850, partial [Acinetobacter baumannii]
MQNSDWFDSKNVLPVFPAKDKPRSAGKTISFGMRRRAADMKRQRRPLPVLASVRQYLAMAR